MYFEVEFKLSFAIIFFRSNAVVSQCLTKNKWFEDMRWVGAFGVYVVVSVGGFWVECGDQLVVFDLDDGIQKIDFILSKIYCKLDIGVS